MVRDKQLRHGREIEKEREGEGGRERERARLAGNYPLARYCSSFAIRVKARREPAGGFSSDTPNAFWKKYGQPISFCLSLLSFLLLVVVAYLGSDDGWVDEAEQEEAANQRENLVVGNIGELLACQVANGLAQPTDAKRYRLQAAMRARESRRKKKEKQGEK